MMDLSAMIQEPHQVLTVAYRDNLVIFATSLRQQATADSNVNLTLARTPVAEMQRSFDQMQFHDKDHVKAVPEAMQARMAKMLAAQHLALQSDLTALDEEVQTSTPDSRSISKLVGVRRCTQSQSANSRR